jgi:hypothetical protein
VQQLRVGFVQILQRLGNLHDPAVGVHVGVEALAKTCTGCLLNETLNGPTLTNLLRLHSHATMQSNCGQGHARYVHI